VSGRATTELTVLREQTKRRTNRPLAPAFVTKPVVAERRSEPHPAEPQPPTGPAAVLTTVVTIRSINSHPDALSISTVVAPPRPPNGRLAAAPTVNEHSGRFATAPARGPPTGFQP
jgi:hypothetical protein